MMEPMVCATGAYQSSENGTQCVTCPQGHKCDDITMEPVPCLAGEYQSGYGQTNCKQVFYETVPGVFFFQ